MVNDWTTSKLGSEADYNSEADLESVTVMVVNKSSKLSMSSKAPRTLKVRNKLVACADSAQLRYDQQLRCLQMQYITECIVEKRCTGKPVGLS